MDASFALGRLLLNSAEGALTGLSVRDKEQVRGDMGGATWVLHQAPARSLI